MKYIHEALNEMYQPFWVGRVEYTENGTPSFHPEHKNQMPDLEDVLAKIEAIKDVYEALEQIQTLEAEITPRRQREALLTEEGKAWLVEQDAKIAALRAQLAKQ
jgi:hypothetical protein